MLKRFALPLGPLYAKRRLGQGVCRKNPAARGSVSRKPVSGARSFGDLRDRAGLRRTRPGDLRHSAAALLTAQGVHPKAIQELLGHSSVAFTMQVYGRLFEETKREAAEKMDSIPNPVATPVAATAPNKGLQGTGSC